MANVLLVAYLLIVLALIVVILLQRSEGGALGIGGGGGGGLMTARGSANLLTRTTAILATLFFALAIGLTIINELDRGTSSILDSATSAQDGAAPTTVLDAINALGGGDNASDLPLPVDNTVAPTNTTTNTGTDLPVPAAPATTTEAPAATTTEAPAAETEAPANDTAAPVEIAPAAPAQQTPAAPAGN